MNGHGETAHGQRQVHHTLDYLAVNSPERSYAAIPVTQESRIETPAQDR